MGKYEHVLDLMHDTGHFPGEKDRWSYGEGYRKVPFTPQGLVGIAVHALVSGRPWENYVIDEDGIHFPRNGAQGYDGSARHKEDVLREDLVLQLINAAPSNVRNDFESVDGHLRASDFSYAFQGREREGDYLDFLREIAESKGLPAGLIRTDEAKRIRRRVSRNHDYIARLLRAMRKDEHPMPEYADRLEEALAEYGYEPGDDSPSPLGEDGFLL